MNPLPFTDNCLFVDATAFEKYTTCNRSFEYYFLEKRESAQSRPALDAGAIFHSVMEVRRRLEAGPNLPLDSIERIQEEFIHLCYAGHNSAGQLSLELGEYLKERSPVTNEDQELREWFAKTFPGWTPPLNDFRTESHMINVIRAYNVFYSIEPFKPVMQDGKPLVEMSFALPLVTLDYPAIHPKPISIYWTGRLDLPVLWSDSELWNVDYKTGTIDDGFDEYANNQAQIGYLWALWKLLGTVPSGFMIDKVLWRAPSAKGKGIEFKRHRERISLARIEEWERNTVQIFEDILHDYARGYFPMKSGWCKGKFGCCQYLDVCKLSPEGRAVLLQSPFYKDVTWSPLR